MSSLSDAEKKLLDEYTKSKSIENELEHKVKDYETLKALKNIINSLKFNLSSMK